MELKVVFWSGSGNTESMADMVAKGIKEAGQEAKVISIEDITPEVLAADAVFAMGCPAMGDEVLEETIVEPFVTDIEKLVNGKKIALFGSYGWGDGEWMRNWVERMEKAGAVVIGGEGVICADAPDEEAEEKLTELGKKMAEA